MFRNCSAVVPQLFPVVPQLTGDSHARLFSQTDGGVILRAGRGRGDTIDEGTIYVYDTADFPFYRGEQYHQFHANTVLRRAVPASYTGALKAAQIRAHKIDPTGWCATQMWTALQPHGPNHLGFALHCAPWAADGPDHLGLCAPGSPDPGAIGDVSPAMTPPPPPVSRTPAASGGVAVSAFLLAGALRVCRIGLTANCGAGPLVQPPDIIIYVAVIDHHQW